MNSGSKKEEEEVKQQNGVRKLVVSFCRKSCPKNQMNGLNETERVNGNEYGNEETIIELTLVNVFKASAENFIAIKTKGFCARFMENFMIFMASTSHGKSKRARFAWPLSWFSSLVFPCQSHEYNKSAVFTL